MRLLSGKPIAKKILDQVSREAKKLHARGITPTLAVILIGDDPASQVYVKQKQKVAKSVGIDFLLYHLPKIKQVELEQLLITLQLDPTVHGIIIQLPLPKNLSLDKCLKYIDKEKDVDALTPGSNYISPTAQAVMELLNFYKIDFKKQSIAIIGKGVLVGKPLEDLLDKKGAKVVVYDRETTKLSDKTKKSNIIITATGTPKLIDKNFVKSGQTIIDVGSARDPKTNKVVGDVNRLQVKKIVAALTPRIGGVGPVTVALLMQNTIKATKNPT